MRVVCYFQNINISAYVFRNGLVESKMCCGCRKLKNLRNRLSPVIQINFNLGCNEVKDENSKVISEDKENNEVEVTIKVKDIKLMSKL